MAVQYRMFQIRLSWIQNSAFTRKTKLLGGLWKTLSSSRLSQSNKAWPEIEIRTSKDLSITEVNVYHTTRDWISEHSEHCAIQIRVHPQHYSPFRAGGLWESDGTDDSRCQWRGCQGKRSHRKQRWLCCVFLPNTPSKGKLAFWVWPKHRERHQV